jgi:hypothetical protein
VANMPATFVARGFLAALIGVMVSCTEQIQVGYPYRVANYLPVYESDSDELKVFPFEGQPVTIPVPMCLGQATFGPDGRSVYGF